MNRTRLNRDSRLRSVTPLRRYKPIAPVSAKRAGAAGGLRVVRPDTGPDRATRQLVKERADWHCEVCGISVFSRTSSIHHRRGRGNGGSSDPAINRPSNLLLVCGTGITECHGALTRNKNRPAALAAGWAVELNSGTAPADVPVRHALYGPVYLRDDGTVTPVEGEAA